MHTTPRRSIALKVYPARSIVIFMLGLICPAQAAPKTEAKDIVSIQIRAQGLPCTNPTQAIRDIEDSSRDEMAWVITCREATYRVKLIPHVGAKIEIIEQVQSDAGVNGEKE